MNKTNQPRKTSVTREECDKAILPIRDALDILNSKWKLRIIALLSALGPLRFTQLSRELDGITDKMLSKELKELELNHLVTRTVHDAFPPVVEYTATEYARTLDPVVQELHDWGTRHRKKIMS